VFARKARALCVLACVLGGCDCRPSAVTTSTQDKVARPAPAATSYVAPDAARFGSASGLSFLEHVYGAAPDARLPMVVLIHGMGDRPRVGWPEVLGSTLKQPVRYILPQAPRPYGSGFSWFDYEIHGVNEPRSLANGIAGACEQLARAIAVLRDHRPTVGRAIVSGFSQGGMLSFALALRHPELVAAAQPISGTLPEPLWPTARPHDANLPSIRALHGMNDTIVPIDGPRRLVARLRELGYDATLEEFPATAHEISPGMALRLTQTVGDAVRTRETAPVQGGEPTK
jgi:phospholipase/carboxylesterase